MTLYAKTLSLPRLRKDVDDLGQMLTRDDIAPAILFSIKSAREDFQAEIDFRVSLQDVDAFLNTSPHRHR
jgi:hypothetical protein